MQSIKERNALFEKMSPKDRRVALAEDVLLYLRTKRIKAEGVYFMVDNVYTHYYKQAHTLLESKMPTCLVCARGALFMATVGYKDAVTVGEVNAMNATQMAEYMDGTFPVEELQRIEVAFEQWDWDSYESNWSSRRYLQQDEVEEASGFCRLRSRKSRLAAIMLNIIANGGTFKPEQPSATHKEITEVLRFADTQPVATTPSLE